MAKQTEDYGLQPLTFREAAAALGVDEADFIRWVLTEVRPSPSRWAEWSKREDEKGWRPIPEKLIRLYLTQQRGGATVATTPPAGGPPSPSASSDMTTRARRSQKRARG